MLRSVLKVWLPGMLLAFIAGQAWAEVAVTFYAHPGARIRGGDLLFPHAYVHAVGTLDDTGEAVDWSAGFTAKYPGPQLLLAKGPGEVQHPDPRYVNEGQPYLRVVVSDAVYRQMRTRADWWNGAQGPEGAVYDLRRRNCITFVADLARLVGLTTAQEPSMKPGTFLEATAGLNPSAAWSGGIQPLSPPPQLEIRAAPLDETNGAREHDSASDLAAH